MSWFRNIRQTLVLRRHSQEQYYEMALLEIESGRRRSGLWAQAIAKGSGSEERAKSFYLKLLVQKLIDEHHTEEWTAERFDKQSDSGARDKPENPYEPVIQFDWPDKSTSEQVSGSGPLWIAIILLLFLIGIPILVVLIMSK